VREWTLYVRRGCGDYDLAPELEHLPNQRCAGLKDPSLIEPVTVVPKFEVTMRDARLDLLTRDV
jgi:hypothetical protein